MAGVLTSGLTARDEKEARVSDERRSRSDPQRCSVALRKPPQTHPREGETHGRSGFEVLVSKLTRAQLVLSEVPSPIGSSTGQRTLTVWCRLLVLLREGARAPARPRSARSRGGAPVRRRFEDVRAPEEARLSGGDEHFEAGARARPLSGGLRPRSCFRASSLRKASRGVEGLGLSVRRSRDRD